MKSILQIFGFGLLFLTALVLLAGFSFGWQWVTAPFYGQLEARKTVQSGEFRLYSYEHFYDLCASVQRKQRALQSQKSLLNSDRISDKEVRRIHTRIAALQSQIQGDVSQYNADARKEKTKGQFRAADLPQHINYSEEIVSCN